MPMSNNGLRLAIACPMANERETAERFICEVLATCEPLQAVIFVAVFDSSCTDGTREIVETMAREDARIKVVFSPKNTCPVDAYLCSYRVALDSDYEWILEINAGYRHQPSDIPKFFRYMREGYDCIFGSRFISGGTMVAPTFRRRLYSQGGTWLANRLLGTQLKDMTSGFQMFRREVLESLLARGIRSRYHFFQTEMKAYCKHFRSAEVPVQYRTAGRGLRTHVLADAFYHLVRLVVMRATGKL